MQSRVEVVARQVVEKEVVVRMRYMSVLVEVVSVVRRYQTKILRRLINRYAFVIAVVGVKADPVAEQNATPIVPAEIVVMMAVEEAVDRVEAVFAMVAFVVSMWLRAYPIL